MPFPGFFNRLKQVMKHIPQGIMNVAKGASNVVKKLQPIIDVAAPIVGTAMGMPMLGEAVSQGTRMATSTIDKVLPPGQKNPSFGKALKRLAGPNLDPRLNEISDLINKYRS